MAREVAEAREKAVVVVTCGREVHRERAAEDLQNNAAASPNLKLVRKRLVGRTSRRGGGIPEPPDFLIEKSASRSSRAGRGRSGSAPERASGHAAVRSHCFTGLTISVFGRESTGRFKLPPLVEGYDEFDDTEAPEHGGGFTAKSSRPVRETLPPPYGICHLTFRSQPRTCGLG